MGTRRARRTSIAARRRRHTRVRRRVYGTAARPRLAVFRSNSYIYCQLIDDDRGVTLAAASDLEPALRPRNGRSKQDQARLVGARVAERARAAGLQQVVFDRGGYRFHGRVKALADAARDGGLAF